ncbi:MAG: hypothetical protein KAI47_04915 [Deltaproteobacteria bacterium]|nr:hypothetical protein [Deltaproteobacteria bacterium]
MRPDISTTTIPSSPRPKTRVPSHQRGYRPSAFKLLNLIGLLALAGVTIILPACGDEPVAHFSAKIVQDRKVMSFVEVFQIFAIKPQTRDGQSVTCSDFPTPFHIGDAALQLCFGDDQAQLQPGCQAQTAWSGETKAATLKLRIPTGERLLIIAKGLANTPGGPFVVARGCQENLTFGEGSNPPVTLDVLASVGRPCFDDSDCETMTTCNNTDPDLPGGYCSRWPCNADLDCLPGSVCVLDEKTGGLCARACDTVADCKGTGKTIYGCEHRSGTGGCQAVCVWHDWNKSKICTP